MRVSGAGVSGVALVASACLLTSSALLTTPIPTPTLTPTPTPSEVTCPGNGTHSSYKCPSTKICCKLGCCNPSPELTVEAAVTIALLFAMLLGGALLIWWLQWRPRRRPCNRSRLLVTEEADDGCERRRTSITGPTSSSVLQ